MSNIKEEDVDYPCNPKYPKKGYVTNDDHAFIIENIIDEYKLKNKK